MSQQLPKRAGFSIVSDDNSENQATFCIGLAVTSGRVDSGRNQSLCESSPGLESDQMLQSVVNLRNNLVQIIPRPPGVGVRARCVMQKLNVFVDLRLLSTAPSAMYDHIR